MQMDSTPLEVLARLDDGVVSQLWLIRSTAINAVLDGTERITRKTLESVHADFASQDNSPDRR